MSSGGDVDDGNDGGDAGDASVSAVLARLGLGQHGAKLQENGVEQVCVALVWLWPT